MSKKIQAVLVGTSLDTTSDPVVRASIQLAQRFGADLYLLHAHALPTAFLTAPTGLTAVQPDLLESERQVRQHLLDEQLKRVGGSRADLTGSIIEAGAPHRMLLEAAAAHDVDLIVVGTRETSGLALHGSTTDRVLRKATCPVWVVSGQTSLPPQRLLAPVDLSPLSEECLKTGLDLMAEIGAAEYPDVEALFVLTSEEHESSTQFTPQQIERLAHEELDRLVERLPKGSSIRRQVRIGEIRQEILLRIDQAACDLLVLGTHGRSGFERFLLGSVASDMAGKAPCDVLVIPPEEAAS